MVLASLEMLPINRARFRVYSVILLFYYYSNIGSNIILFNGIHAVLLSISRMYTCTGRHRMRGCPALQEEHSLDKLSSNQILPEASLCVLSLSLLLFFLCYTCVNLCTSLSHLPALIFLSEWLPTTLWCSPATTVGQRYVAAMKMEKQG